MTCPYDAIFLHGHGGAMYALNNQYRNNMQANQAATPSLQNFSNLQNAISSFLNEKNTFSQTSLNGIGRDKGDSMCVFLILSFALFQILLLFPRAFQSVKLPLQGSVHHTSNILSRECQASKLIFSTAGWKTVFSSSSCRFITELL